jgi:hypothetical protein
MLSPILPALGQMRRPRLKGRLGVRPLVAVAANDETYQGESPGVPIASRICTELLGSCDVSKNDRVQNFCGF